MATVEYQPSHLGICVSDLDQAMRFWCDGLGFEKAETFEVGAEFGPSLEVEGETSVVSQFLRNGGMAIELLAYSSPGVIGAASTRRNQLGLTHLSFIVDDVDAAAKRMVEFGGTILDDTRFGADDPASVQILFIAGPDGVRVELMRYGAE